MTATDAAASAWIDALIARHVAPFRRSEFLKALRALSARYVEQRAQLPDRSALDSAGKRAAFAGFFAPLHFFTTLEIVRALSAQPDSLDEIVDLGCGTGAASAAWSLTAARRPRVTGVDRETWALEEARWTWQRLGLDGRAHRGDMMRHAELLARDRRQSVSASRQGVICAWSANELSTTDRVTLLGALLTLARSGVTVLVIEPIASSATPWWTEWSTAFVAAGGRSDVWRFEHALPAAIAKLDDEAGFQREGLKGKSLFVQRSIDLSI